jgi:hypothetical protein
MRQDKDKTRQDKTRQDKTRQDKTRQDNTRQDKKRQDKQDKTRQDRTNQSQLRKRLSTPVEPLLSDLFLSYVFSTLSVDKSAFRFQVS